MEGDVEPPHVARSCRARSSRRRELGTLYGTDPCGIGTYADRCDPLMRLTLLTAAVLMISALAATDDQIHAQLTGARAARPTVFVSTTGNDGGRCTSTSPCRSLNRAYRVASPGTVVQVAGGSYGDQTIESDPAKNAARAVVTFRPASGATASFADLTLSADHILFAGTGLHNGFSFGGWMAMPGAEDVTSATPAHGSLESSARARSRS